MESGPDGGRPRALARGRRAHGSWEGRRRKKLRKEGGRQNPWIVEPFIGQTWADL